MTRLTEMFAYGALACSSFLFGTGAYRVAVDGLPWSIAALLWCRMQRLRNRQWSKGSAAGRLGGAGCYY